MVGDVDGPEEADLVVPAMQPVIEEVFRQQEEQPIGENIGNGYPVVDIAALKNEQIYHSEEEIDGAIEEHQVEIADGVFERIEFSVPSIAKQDLQADDDEI
jgi:hypothetical protein